MKMTHPISPMAFERIMTMTTKQPVISAVFQDRYDAIEAHSFVKSMGYADSEINVLMSDTTRKRFDEDPDTKHSANTMGLEGIATGGMIGTAVGATAAAIAAIGTSILIPGLRCNSSAIRRVSCISSVLWWVTKGRAAAPPAIACRTGVSASTNPRSRNVRRIESMIFPRCSIRSSTPSL